MEQKMSRVSLQNGGGPGSSISLAPETIKVRNALIEKFTDEPLDEMNHFMNTALAAEKNELRRIGILAARIFLLRTRIANLRDFNRDPSLTNISELTAGALDLGDANIDATEESDDDVTEIEDGWARLKMTSPGEVQGVRFLSGAIIDAKPEDAEKLIQSGKAIRVDENGSPVEFHEDDFDNQNTATSRAEAEDLAMDENGSIKENDRDSSETDEDASSNTAGEQAAEATAEDLAEDGNGGIKENDRDNSEADEDASSNIAGEQAAEATSDEQPVMATADSTTSDDAATAKSEQPVSPDDELSGNVDDKT
jgi:hypothetical protein